MLISIIVPIYNTQKYLSKCIESILAQTYKNIEVILVNDGSTDNSLVICEEYQKKDNRIKLYSQENRGLIASRCLGVEKATGELIGFVDSDDWIESDYYENMYAAYEQTKCDLVSTGMIRDYENGSDSKVILDNYKEGYYDNLPKDIYPTMIFDEKEGNHGLFCNLVSKLFKKNILEEVLEKTNKKVFYGEDALILYQYCLKIKSLFVLKKAFYHYNIRNDSMCFSVNKNSIQNTYFLFTELESSFKNNCDYYILMRQLRKYFLMVIIPHDLELLYGYNVASLGEWTFNYNDVVLNSNIVIYGAGGCGQALYRYLIDQGKKENIITWVDKNADERKQECMYPIQYPNVLNDKQYDYILIAVQNENLAEKIQDELISVHHIDKSCIIWEPSSYIPVFGDIHYAL